MRLDIVGNQTASVDGGLAAAASVAASGATAAITSNLVAPGIRAGARAMGRECPRDLSIVGIDDQNGAAVSEPSLTTVRIDLPNGGARAYQMLSDLVSGKKVAPDAEHRPSQLIVRHSTTFAPEPLGTGSGATHEHRGRGPQPRASWELFEQSLQAGSHVTWVETIDMPGLDSVLADAEVVVTSRLPASCIETLHSVRLVHAAGTGVDGIASHSLPAHVTVSNTVHHEAPIAEYILAALIVLRRRLLTQDRALRNGEWSSPVYDPPLPQAQTPHGARITFLGFGQSAARPDSCCGTSAPRASRSRAPAGRRAAAWSAVGSFSRPARPGVTRERRRGGEHPR